MNCSIWLLDIETKSTWLINFETKNQNTLCVHNMCTWQIHSIKFIL